MRKVRFNTTQCSEELLRSLRGNSRPEPVAYVLLDGYSRAVYHKLATIQFFQLKIKNYANEKRMQKYLPRWQRCIEEVRSFT